MSGAGIIKDRVGGAGCVSDCINNSTLTSGDMIINNAYFGGTAGTGIDITGSGLALLRLSDIKMSGGSVSANSYGVFARNNVAVIGDTVKCWGFPGSGSYGCWFCGPALIKDLHTRKNSKSITLQFQYIRIFINLNMEEAEADRFNEGSSDARGIHPLTYYSVQKYLTVEGDNRRYYKYGEIRSVSGLKQEAGVAYVLK